MPVLPMPASPHTTHTPPPHTHTYHPRLPTTHTPHPPTTPHTLDVCSLHDVAFAVCTGPIPFYNILPAHTCRGEQWWCHTIVLCLRWRLRTCPHTHTAPPHHRTTPTLPTHAHTTTPYHTRPTIMRTPHHLGLLRSGARRCCKYGSRVSYILRLPAYPSFAACVAEPYQHEGVITRACCDWHRWRYSALQYRTPCSDFCRA